jgi:tripartite-type tricarboxylate transporter receptor subunit TctC
MLTRRSMLGALMGAPLTPHFAGTANAQAGYPDRAVKIIVPFPPGGPADITGRLVAQALGDRLTGATFVVENRTGAGGTIGLGALAQSRPDGYTLGVGAGGALTMMPQLQRVPYDALHDFQPLTIVIALPQVLTVSKTLPVRTVAELVALARKKPGEITYGSSGIGASLHLATELFKLRVGGLDIVHVPYRGVMPALTDLMGGQIDILFGDLSPMLPQIRAGTIVPIAVAARERAALLPDVPTMRECGVADAEAESFYGILAPASLPKELTSLLHKALVGSLAEPALQRQVVDQGGVVVGNTPEEFQAYIVSETKKWGDVIRLANVKI